MAATEIKLAEGAGFPAGLAGDFAADAAAARAAGGDGRGRAILAAALALPLAAQGETAPERGELSLRYLNYHDSQPGLDRIRVTAPSLAIVAPVAGEWAVDAAFTVDTISGASPSFHTAEAGFGKVEDRRHGETIGLTRYLPRASLGVRATVSEEGDFSSRALAVAGSVSSEDSNWTFNFGAGTTLDHINPTNKAVLDEHRKTHEFLVGVTRVLGRQDIAQLTLAQTSGRGYFSDPYKFLDNRPRTRRQSTLTARWNHHFAGPAATLRLSYRYYVDTFAVEAHSLGGEWVQALAPGWTVVPSLRLYAQEAARFYLPPETPGLPVIPDGFRFGSTLLSEDQRLASFGGRTLGFKLIRQFGPDWSVDVKHERYEQRGAWALTDRGSGGLAPFRARITQVGISRSF